MLGTSHIKNADFLNRQQNRLIMLDADPMNCVKNPHNAILLKKWDGNPEDKTLIWMIPFLEDAMRRGGSQLDDIRHHVKMIRGVDIAAAAAFVENNSYPSEKSISKSYWRYLQDIPRNILRSFWK